MRVLAFLLVTVALAPVEVAFAQAARPAIPPATPAVQLPAPSGPVQDLPATICNQTVPAPSQSPPAGSPTLVTAVMLCFEKQGGNSVIEAQTYVYYIQLHGSRPSMNEWIRYDESAQQAALNDFKRLWATNFLDDL